VTAGSATVVEALRQGKHPTDACLVACQRIADATKVKRLQRDDGKPDFNVRFYAVDKQGRYGGGSLFGGELAVCDGKGNRKEELARLFER
jgi:N4-(beta-N-acetylglucosaminyl)-L-asparaginase